MTDCSWHKWMICSLILAAYGILMNYDKIKSTVKAKLNIKSSFQSIQPTEDITLSIPPYSCTREFRKKNHRPDMKCEDFYSNTSVQEFYSHCYHEEMKQLEQRLSEVLKNLKLSGLQEGHNGRVGREPSLKCIFDIASNIKFTNVCEIGFNAGHSALNWLVANEHSHVYSWDIGRWHYTKKMMEYLQKEFPGRLTVFLGDSTKVVPKVAQENSFKCDVISVDGGHTFNIARADILNMRAFAHKKTILLVDDTFRSRFGLGIAKAVDLLVSQNVIARLYNCTYAVFGGFTIAKYVF